MVLRLLANFDTSIGPGYIRQHLPILMVDLLTDGSTQANSSRLNQRRKEVKTKSNEIQMTSNFAHAFARMFCRCPQKFSFKRSNLEWQIEKQALKLGFCNALEMEEMGVLMGNLVKTNHKHVSKTSA